ncbi:hypothetical protein ACIF70_42405 [Actinacidiphila glaucinigra]|uniref:hypothetical protein n=1 Tax=Actinacidiphila glaucinigra TaxID=235986 RepID=UPI0037CC460A
MRINSITVRRVAAAALAAPILALVGVGTAAAAPQQTPTTSQQSVIHGGCWGHGCGYGGYGYGPGYGYGGYGYGPGYGGNGVIVILG